MNTQKIEYPAIPQAESIGPMLRELSELCSALDELIADYQSMLDELDELIC